MSGLASTWPEPFERVYQSQSRRTARVLGARRPDITKSARLLIAGAVALGDERPHGMITWLADAFRTSRQTIYDIGAGVERQLEGMGRAVVQPVRGAMSRKQVAGAALTLLIGGTMTIRRTRMCLKGLLAADRSVGWLCGLIDEAGTRAAAAVATERQRPALLTYHDWLACDLSAWRRSARGHFDDDEVAAYFERFVLRTWRLERAVTNGRHTQRAAAERSRTLLTGLCLGDAAASALAADLSAALDHAVRASSIVELVNGLLRMFLAQRRHLHDRRRAQHWLNLFILWHNMRVYERGKRAGKSPYEIVGVTVSNPDGAPTTDWLDALGYAQAA